MVSVLFFVAHVALRLMYIMCTGPTGAGGAADSRAQDLAIEKGTIHTKRHSGEDHLKNGYLGLNAPMFRMQLSTIMFSQCPQNLQIRQWPQIVLRQLSSAAR